MDNNLKRYIRPLGDLQRSVERYETLNDGFVLPDLRLVVRLDAHRFGDWSKVPASEYPCGETVSRALVGTAGDLMRTGFQCILAMIHGDEIAVYLDPRETQTPRRRGRLLSLFSSAASTHFLRRFGLPALFHAKLSELPSHERVIEYFMWQRRAALRNAIVTATRRILIDRGYSAEKAEAQIQGVPEESRIAQLESLGCPLSQLNLHTRHGTLVWWGKPQNSTQLALQYRMGLPESDEEFLTLLAAKLTGPSVPADVAASLAIGEEVPQVSPPQQQPAPVQQRRPAVVFAHEKGSKRNTTIVKAPVSSQNR